MDTIYVRKHESESNTSKQMIGESKQIIEIKDTTEHSRTEAPRLDARTSEYSSGARHCSLGKRKEKHRKECEYRTSNVR
jgi:hypothetical protein